MHRESRIDCHLSLVHHLVYRWLTALKLIQVHTFRAEVMTLFKHWITASCHTGHHWNGCSFLNYKLHLLKYSELLNSLLPKEKFYEFSWCSFADDGNCLLHAISTAVWGVHDDFNTLRRTLNAEMARDHQRRQTYFKRWSLHRKLQDRDNFGASIQDSMVSRKLQDWSRMSLSFLSGSEWNQACLHLWCAVLWCDMLWCDMLWWGVCVI